ncbi:hypothetical protein HanIR_Chr09g0429851 [Helianthus annuus]|nr:hypothetical protein HanIR_Chr09g0429851 [Helianthus annuus]
MGVRPLHEDEESWYEQIRGNFMYPVADAFASPPSATEGVLRDLGVDLEEKKKKPLKKKKKIANVDPEVTSKGAVSSRATAAAGKAGTKTGVCSSRSSRSAGSRNPDAGATPSVHEEEEAEEEEEAVVQLVSRKRVRSETTAGVAAATLTGAVPLVGKTSNLRSLYKFSPEIKKKTPEKGVKFTEPEPKRPKITIKSSQTIGGESAKEKNVAEKDVARAVEAQRKAEERQKKMEEEKKRKAE